MTQQYLVGELSLLLGQLHTAMANEASAVEVARLRQRAETGPPSGLASVVMRALEVAEAGQLRVEMGEGPGQGVHTALSSATSTRTGSRTSPSSSTARR